MKTTTGNHGEQNYYQPGSRLPPSKEGMAGGDQSVDDDSAWHDISGLSISYTPPVDVQAEIALYVDMSCDKADNRVWLAIDVNGADERVGKFHLDDTGIHYQFTIVLYNFEMTAGTAYTIKGQVNLRNEGINSTGTVYDDDDQTGLALIPFRHP